MEQFMEQWPNGWGTGLGSKPPGGSKINPTFDPSEIDQMSARNLRRYKVIP